MTGKWIFVCGSSGAGKDSVIAWSSQALALQSDIVFARRLITRTAQPGSDHDAVDKPDFLSLRQSGNLRWFWQAHGFHYGISQHYASHVSAGGIVVINGSRSHVDGLPASPEVKRVEIMASLDKIAARLEQRGRDTQEAVQQRLARNASLQKPGSSKVDLAINNDTEVAEAGAILAAYLIAQAGVNAPLARSKTAA